MSTFIILLLLYACQPQVTVKDGDTAAPLPDALGITAAPVFDPVAGAPLDIQVSGLDDAQILVLDGAGQEVATVTGSWDGRDDAGSLVSSGEYLLQVSRDAPGPPVTAEQAVRVVRCGVITAWAEGDGGVSAQRVPLYAYRQQALQDEGAPFVSLSGLEDDSGVPTEFPAPSDELAIWEHDANQPVAFTWDSRPILTLQLGDETVLGSAGLVGADVHLAVSGWSVLSGDLLDPATPVVLQADEPLSDTLGVWDEYLDLVFTVVGEDGTSWEIVHQELPVRWYTTLRAPSFHESGALYTAWHALVGPALQALDGVAPEKNAVVDALVEWLFYDSGLRYDTNWGASAYTQYVRNDWSQAHFMASDFVERRFGSTINCSDCASILLTYANMLGAELNYTIVLQNFDLNYILAIGESEFTHCPFGAWGCSFSYHVVNTDDGGGSVWDLTLALDGDGDPSHSPCDTLLVQTLDGDEYLDRLVMSGRADFQYEAQGTIQ